MAEVKRTAHKGKMNRDLDDRLVPNGEYRLGVNVNIGRSDGSDVGAVENLQGNTLQDVANDPLLQNSEVIGVVKDPNSDKIYYFTTSNAIDANGLENGVDQIREFDAATGNIKTILTDTKAETRDGSLPTCLPDVTVDITLPDGVLAIPPGFPAFPSEPVGGCNDPAATNFDPNATFDDGSCEFGFGCANAGFTAELESGSVVGFVQRGTINSISGDNFVGGTATANIQIPAGESNFPGTIDCSATITPAQYRVGISGDVTAINGTTVTLTAFGVNEQGGASTFAWSTGAVTQSITVTGTDQTVTVLVTGTDGSGQTASASHSVVFAATPPSPTTYTLTNTASGSGDFTLTAGASASELPGTAFSANVGISANSGSTFVANPVATFSGGNGGGGSQSGNTFQVNDTHGVGNITANVNWTNVATSGMLWECTGGAGSGSCTQTASGTHATQAACEAAADCAAVVVPCNSITVNNPSGNNNAIFSYFQCNTNACALIMANVSAGTSITICVQEATSTNCSSVSRNITVGGNAVTLNAQGFALTDQFGSQTGIPGATATVGGSC